MQRSLNRSPAPHPHASPLTHAESVVLANLAASYPRPLSAFSVARDGLKYFQLNRRQSIQGMVLLTGRGLARVRHNHMMLTARGHELLGEVIAELGALQ